MPLLLLQCSSCGHIWEALTSVADPDLDRCPSCSAPSPERLPMAGALLRGMDWDGLPQLEKDEHLEAKAYYESLEFSRRVLSGEVNLVERGPKWLRPKCPESLRRKYF